MHLTFAMILYNILQNPQLRHLPSLSTFSYNRRKLLTKFSLKNQHGEVARPNTVVTPGVVRDVYLEALRQSTFPPDKKRNSLRRNVAGNNS